MGKKKIKKIVPYMYLVPSTVIMAVMLGFPIVYNIVISFFDWTLMNKDKTFNGLTNYINVLSDDKFLKILTITIIWTLLGVVLQMGIGIGMALFTDSITRGKKYLRTIMLIPWIIPGVVTALMWRWMMQADVGIINAVLKQVGLMDKNILFLSDTSIVLIVLVLINTWKAAPFWFLMITASLQNKPTDQIEAALIDRAKYRHILRYVIMPHLAPTIASTGILTTIWTLNYFDLIWVTTKGGPMDATSTLPVYTYRMAFEFNDFGGSAAVAVISLVLVSLICIPYVRKMFQNLKYEGVL